MCTASRRNWIGGDTVRSCVAAFSTSPSWDWQRRRGGRAGPYGRGPNRPSRQWGSAGTVYGRSSESVGEGHPIAEPSSGRCFASVEGGGRCVFPKVVSEERRVGKGGGCRGSIRGGAASK